MLLVCPNLHGVFLLVVHRDIIDKILGKYTFI